MKRSHSIGRTLISALVCLHAVTAHSQNMPDAEAAAPVFDQNTQKGFESLTSALTVLTTDDSVTGGRFTLEGRGEDANDADIDVIKLWNEIPVFAKDSTVVPLLEFNLSYLRFEQNDSLGSAEIDNWALGAGVGVRFAFFEELLQLTPRFKVEYADYDFDVRLDGLDQALVDSVIPDIYAWTYLPSLELALQPEFEAVPGRLSFGTRVSYIYVDAQSSKTSLSDFSSESWVMRNFLAFEVPFEGAGLVKKAFVRPQLARVDLYGDARDGFELNNFYETGFDVLSRELFPTFFSEIGLGFRYVFEDRINGWRLGLFGDFS